MAGRPDAILVTVCGAAAPEGLSDYDRSCGFRSSFEAVAARRAEDVAAARILGAKAVHMLAFADGQYGTALDPTAVAAALAEVVDGSGAHMVVGPLGLAHPDHEAVAAAVLEVAADPDLEVWLYEELPARVLWPETVAPALGRVRDAGFEPELGFIGTGLLSTKMLAVRAYRSQLGALTRATAGAELHPVFCPERFHLLRRP